jgi:hypothetical protein
MKRLEVGRDADGRRLTRVDGQPRVFDHARPEDSLNKTPGL